MTKALTLAEILWDYHTLKQKPKPADLIFGLGSIDIRTAHRAAELYKQQFAPCLLFSGGVAHSNDILRTTWLEPESVVFAKEAIRLGVPEDAILLEKQATNTGENITLGYKVLQEHNLNPQSIILVQKPYMERRTYATFAKQWPGGQVTFYVTSPNTSFQEYVVNAPRDEQEKILNIMVGDLQRIKAYPEKGFQIHQDIPTNVWEAFEELVTLGYDKHLIKD